MLFFADAGKYLGNHPANGTAKHPASRDNRAVREDEADPAQQGVDSSEPLSPFHRGNGKLSQKILDPLHFLPSRSSVIRDLSRIIAVYINVWVNV